MRWESIKTSSLRIRLDQVPLFGTLALFERPLTVSIIPSIIRSGELPIFHLPFTEFL